MDLLGGHYMSHQYLNQKNVNIDVYPQLDIEHQLAQGMQVTLGDLHGNFQKLLYAVVRHGALEITPDDFSHLKAIYNRKPLQAADIKQFKELLARIEVNPKSKDSLLRLIGDVLADRGANDYLTLKLLQKFKQGGLPFENLLSNHDAEFIELYESGQPFNQSKLDEQANSANQLQDLIDRNLVSRDEINALVEECYKPSLKALSYSFNEEGKLTIYSHAAIDPQKIRYMADKLDLPWLGDDDPSIARTIDAINSAFAEHVQNNTVTRLIGLDEVPLRAINGQEPIDAQQFPFAHLIWNRSTRDLQRSAHIDFVHGHDKSDLTQGNIFNVDNDLGKAPGQYHTGTYNVLYSKVKSHAPALVRQQIIIEDYLPIAAIDNTKLQFAAAVARDADEMAEDWTLIEKSSAPVIIASNTAGIWRPLKSMVGAVSNWWWGSSASVTEEEEPVRLLSGMVHSKRGQTLEGSLPEDITTDDSQQQKKRIIVQ